MAGPDRGKALEIALAQIDKQFGKGSVMRLGDEERVPVSVIPTGSIALDAALGIGGLPRGRVVEIFGPESSGKTTVALHSVASAQASGGIAAFIDAEHALDPEYAKVLGVDTDALLVSQPDTGEQALEIADMLIRSGALDILVIDSVAALVPRAEIEGEMGDSHVGLQARLMSQALRKLTGALHNANTTAVFINQLREKVGVMFGCFDYSTQVTLADGTQEKIGKIVDQRMDVEVLTYDSHADKIVARPITNWFNNGATSQFLRFTVEGVSSDSDSQFSATENHLIRTPGGWREAGELIAGDRVLSAGWRRLSDQQLQLVLGSLLGAGELSAADLKQGAVQFRLGSSAQDPEYLAWKQSLLSNVVDSASGEKGLALLPELSELQAAVYLGDGKKYLSWEYMKSLTPMSLAIWYMDMGELTVDEKGFSHGDKIGQVAIGASALSEDSRARLVEYLRDSYGLKASIQEKASSAVIQFDADSSKTSCLSRPAISFSWLAGMSFGVGNFCSRYWMISLLSMCTAPSCTSTGTSPRGLMPRNHGRKFSLANRSTRWGLPLDALEVEEDAELLRA